MKPSNHSALLLTIACAMLALSPLCHAQAQQASIDSYIAEVRAGTQAERVAIISTTMRFNDKDAAAFWPIYRKYEQERSGVDDRRVAVIKQYAAKYPSLTDADAKAMTEEMFACDSRLADLKKTYFKKFNTVLPASTLAKFFQLEHRMDLLMDMNVESSLPPLAQPPTTDPQNKGVVFPQQ
jgi:hypothetical protein